MVNHVEADTILAYLGNPSEGPSRSPSPEGQEPNPVLIDGEEDEHHLSCRIQKRVQLPTEERWRPPVPVPDPLQQGLSGKKLKRPSQLIHLERKLNLRLPKGPFGLSPALSTLVENGKSCQTGLTNPFKVSFSRALWGRPVDKCEDKPHQLIGISLPLQSEQDNRTTYHFLIRVSPISVLEWVKTDCTLHYSYPFYPYPIRIMPPIKSRKNVAAAPAERGIHISCGSCCKIIKKNLVPRSTFLLARQTATARKIPGLQGRYRSLESWRTSPTEALA